MIKIIQNQINKIVIPNNHFTGVTEYNFTITNNMSMVETEFTLTADTINDRFIAFDVDVVDKISLEDLPEKIYMARGLNDIQINNDYTDILFVAFKEDENFAYDKNDYSATTESVFVYKR